MCYAFAEFANDVTEMRNGIAVAETAQIAVRREADCRPNFGAREIFHKIAYANQWLRREKRPGSSCSTKPPKKLAPKVCKCRDQAGRTQI
jgi:hypothetical protein